METEVDDLSVALPADPVSRTHLAASPGRVKKGGDLDALPFDGRLDPRRQCGERIPSPTACDLARNSRTCSASYRGAADRVWPFRMCA
ncbi:hypothetical protein [Streptomyces sp. NBC_00690]|uniref:hypothetical protein n=1 Tax=Streptomyces sp. NBC_00690 TaxID=2975808 RepID=UPI002E2BA522|nr:hypothetical protein [Streptomyces sp. NBC_00690]